MVSLRVRTQPRKLSLALLLCLLTGGTTALAVTRIRASRIRAPRDERGRKIVGDPENPVPPAPKPWDRRTEPRPLRVPRGAFVKEALRPHDREMPTFYGDPKARIWNDLPRFGAGLGTEQQGAIRQEEKPSASAKLLGQGGIKARIRQAIQGEKKVRYQNTLEGLRLMEQYRAEKAMLGLCPIDDCEEPRFILEGKNFSDQGYCQAHSEELLGKRYDWAIEAVEERRQKRRREAQKKARRFESGVRFRGDLSQLGEDRTWEEANPLERQELARELFLQDPLPRDFPQAGDLGPRGSLPERADPRDPAGFPYAQIDPPSNLELPPREASESKSWIQMSQEAP